DAYDLRGLVAELESMPLQERRKLSRLRLDEIARLVRELHRWGYSQRDLKAANILVSRHRHPSLSPFQPIEETSGPVPNSLPWPATSAWFIDLVGVQRSDHVPFQRRVQNLARLNASFLQTPAITRTDRLRFLSTYLQWALRGRHGWKDWWKAVAAATQAKVRRNVRTGRPLG